MIHRTYILAKPVRDTELLTVADDAMEAIGDALEQEYAYQGEENNGKGTVTHTWLELLDETTTIRFAQDDALAACLVVVSSSSDEECQKVSDALCQHLRFANLSDLLQWAKNAETHPAALQLLGIGLNGVKDSAAEDLLKRGLSDRNPEVRYNAAMGASFVRSSNLVEPLRTAFEKEQDEGIRRVLGFALQMCSPS